MINFKLRLYELCHEKARLLPKYVKTVQRSAPLFLLLG